MAGLTAAIKDSLTEEAVTMKPEDVLEDGWDLGEDTAFAVLLDQVKTVCWIHLEPPCRTLSRARRSDCYAKVKP